MGMDLERCCLPGYGRCREGRRRQLGSTRSRLACKRATRRWCSARRWIYSAKSCPAPESPELAPCRPKFRPPACESRLPPTSCCRRPPTTTSIGRIDFDSSATSHSQIPPYTKQSSRWVRFTDPSLVPERSRVSNTFPNERDRLAEREMRKGGVTRAAISSKFAGIGAGCFWLVSMLFVKLQLSQITVSRVRERAAEARTARLVASADQGARLGQRSPAEQRGTRDFCQSSFSSAV